jgi:hypothetical protein
MDNAFDPEFEALLIEAGVRQQEKEEEAPKPRGRFVHLRHLNPKPADYLIDGLFEKNSFGVLLGASQSGKSFITADIAACVATGKPFCGRKTQKGPVVYLAGEGLPGLLRRFASWRAHRSVSVWNMDVWLDTRPVPIIGSERELIRDLGAFKPVLIIVDTLARFYTGSENDNSDMGKFVQTIDDIRREFQATVLLNHHTGKDSGKGGRGASALYAACDFEYTLTKSPRQIRHLDCTKMKDGIKPEEMLFKFYQPKGQSAPVLLPYKQTWDDIKDEIGDRHRIVLEGLCLGKTYKEIGIMAQEKLKLKKPMGNIGRLKQDLIKKNLYDGEKDVLTDRGKRLAGKGV